MSKAPFSRIVIVFGAGAVVWFLLLMRGPGPAPEADAAARVSPQDVELPEVGESEQLASRGLGGTRTALVGESGVLSGGGMDQADSKGGSGTLIRGLILGLDGEPLPKARIRFNDTWKGHRAKTDKQGRFEVELSVDLNPFAALPANPNRREWYEGIGINLETRSTTFEQVGPREFEATFVQGRPDYLLPFLLVDELGRPAGGARCRLNYMTTRRLSGAQPNWEWEVKQADSEGRIEFSIVTSQTLVDWYLWCELGSSSRSGSKTERVAKNVSGLADWRGLGVTPGDLRYGRAPRPSELEVVLVPGRTVDVLIGTRTNSSSHRGRCTLEFADRVIWQRLGANREGWAQAKMRLPIDREYVLAVEVEGLRLDHSIYLPGSAGNLEGVEPVDPQPLGGYLRSAAQDELKHDFTEALDYRFGRSSEPSEEEEEL